MIEKLVWAYIEWKADTATGPEPAEIQGRDA
jgi:hypothetical protein